MRLAVSVKRKRPKKKRWRNKVASETADFAVLVRDEMRAIVRAHGTTTNRDQKIEVQKISDFEYTVGAHDLGLYYLNYGNGGRNRIITPRYGQAMLFVYKGELMVRNSVHGYDGIDFIGQVKRRHGR